MRFCSGRRGRSGVGLMIVGLWGLLAASCGEFQLVEFTRATTTTMEVESPATTIVDTVPETTTSTLRPARYRVEVGDSLGSIAAKFGVSTEALMRENGLPDPDALRAGQELVIPDPNAPVPPPWQERGTDGELSD